MGILIGLHGKMGSGKDESGRQLKVMFGSREEQIELKSFAFGIKLVTAKLCVSPDEPYEKTLAAQYSPEGKNRTIRVIDENTKAVCISVDAAVDAILEFKSFARKSKESVTSDILSLLESECPSSRPASFGELQQIIGVGFRQIYGDDVWVDMLFDCWRREYNWVVTDIRMPNEKERIIDLGGRCVRLRGDPKGERARSKRDLNHITETALDGDNNWDWHIENDRDDIENLKSQLRGFVDKYYPLL